MNDERMGGISPGTRRTLWTVLLVGLAASLGGALLIEKHPHFGIDGIFGFYAMYGFLAGAVLLLLARLLGTLLKRPDSYYDD